MYNILNTIPIQNVFSRAFSFEDAHRLRWWEHDALSEPLSRTARAVPGAAALVESAFILNHTPHKRPLADSSVLRVNREIDSALIVFSQKLRTVFCPPRTQPAVFTNQQTSKATPN